MVQLIFQIFVSELVAALLKRWLCRMNIVVLSTFLIVVWYVVAPAASLALTVVQAAVEQIDWVDFFVRPILYR